MTFLIIKIRNQAIRKTISEWINQNTRDNIKNNILEKLGPNVYLVDSSGEMLALLWSLRKRFNDELDIFLAEPIHEKNLPKEILEVSRWLEESPKSRKILEKVKNLKMTCSINVKEKS